MILSAVNPLTILWSILVLFVLALVFGIVLAVLGKNSPCMKTREYAKSETSSRARIAAVADMQAATLLQRLS